MDYSIVCPYSKNPELWKATLQRLKAITAPKWEKAPAPEDIPTPEKDRTPTLRLIETVADQTACRNRTATVESKTAETNTALYAVGS